MRKTVFALLLSALPFTAFAQSPLGQWTTIDDKTGKPKSVVEITEGANGALSGRVVQVLSSDRGPNPVCDKCTGDRKGKPIEGMTILWGVRRSGDTWEGGQILDPASGKTYSVKLTPTDGGKKLDVRGFMGFSLLGRTQTWVRKQ